MSKETKNFRQSTGVSGRGNLEQKSPKKKCKCKECKCKTKRKKKKITNEEFWKIMSSRFHK